MEDESVPMREGSKEEEVVDYSSMDDKEYVLTRKARIRVIISIVAVLVLVAVAFVVGYVVRLVQHKCGPDADRTSTKTAELVQEAAEQISASRIESQLRYFTKIPHVGGSNESHQQALYMQREWLKYGVDSAELKKYNILLSFPTKPGLASIIAEDGSEVFHAQQKEKVLENAENNSHVLPPFNAYSGSGNVTGRLVYVNYATVKDFQQLKEMNISVAGHIAIARYGSIFRGNKEEHARDAGAIGLILYTDPKDFSPVAPHDTYPNSWWLPPSGVQRGTLFIGAGDPLTEGYPAVDGVYTTPIEKAHLPKLPVYPMSNADAFHFLSMLTETKAPADWQGGLSLTYNLMMSVRDKRNVSLEIQMELPTKPVYNVVGIIKGSVEPDRLVLFGNHRDAWIFGAADPSSGTADLMEVVRVLGELKTKHNWRPRRTLVFLSWGAEEHGLLGSTEWVEDFTNLISNRAVAYLNVDISVQGNYSLRVKSSPLMDFAIFEATKKVRRPGGSSSEDTVFKEWRTKFADKTNPTLPYVSKVGSGSDYAALYNRLGVPSNDFRYSFNTDKWKIASYPVYHSLHDSFHWMKNFVDHDFAYHRAVAQVWVHLGVALADSVIVPFNCTHYGVKLAGYVKDLKIKYGQVLARQKIQLDHLDTAVANLTSAAKKFHKFLESVNKNDPLAVRMANDRLVQFEKSFINPQGLPKSPFKRHVIFAPSDHNTYSGSSFPGLADALYEAHDAQTGDWNQVRKQLTLVVYYIRSTRNLISIESI